MSGPVPNRSEDLARPRERKGGDQMPVTKGVAREVTIPEPDPEWHHISLMLWESLTLSGQADYYQQSDWAFAYSLMDDLSFYKTGQVNRETGEIYHKRSGQMLQTIYAAMSNLLVTEADRRRVRLELEAPNDGEGDAALYAIEDYQRELGLTEPTPTED